MANRIGLILKLWSEGQDFEYYLDIQKNMSAKEIIDYVNIYVDNLNKSKDIIYTLKSITIVEQEESEKTAEEATEEIKGKITIIYDKLANINNKLRAICDYQGGLLVVHAFIFIALVIFFVMKGIF